MRPAVSQPGYLKGRSPANKGKTYPAEVLTPGEVRVILGQFSTRGSLGLRNRALITVLYRAGLRLSEALDLRPKDIDLRDGSITVLHVKGDRRRTVGIDPGAIEVVEIWLDRRAQLGFAPDQPLFCTMRATRIKVSYLRQILPKLARRAGVSKRVHPHGFRHTHAYELMMEGVEMPIIQRQLGHASLATTDTYLNHIAPKQVIEAMRKREWRP